MEKETYTHDWITRVQAGIELEAPEDERRELNAVIAVIASSGCKMYADAGINYRMQKAAKRMMRQARRNDSEPLSELKEVCDADHSLDVYPESFLVVTKYIDAGATYRGSEIIIGNDDIVVFGPFKGNNGGTYEIEVHRNEPDTEGNRVRKNREICSVIHSYDADGNNEGTVIEDFPDYVATARRIWGVA